MDHPEPVLLTDRCRLRALHRDDAPHVWDASRHPGFTDGMLWDPPERMEQIYEFTEQKRALWGTEEYCFTIEEKETAAFLGRITLRTLGTPGLWDIGYFLHPKAWGKGYMTEAAAEVLRFAFGELGASAVESGHFTWNEKSGNVLRRIGMRHVGVVAEVEKHSKRIPEHKYRLTAEEYRART